ncbi:hypothetical protein CCAN2_1500001 [Capnocytophaga canimorsus]|nr:hypothetical protein CCAN2_1500001 [Capnocytophaga canimorsus]
MKLLGVDCGPARYPHVTLTDSQLNEIFQKLENLGLTEYFSKK